MRTVKDNIYDACEGDPKRIEQAADTVRKQIQAFFLQHTPYMQDKSVVLDVEYSAQRKQIFFTFHGRRSYHNGSSSTDFVVSVERVYSARQFSADTLPYMVVSQTYEDVRALHHTQVVVAKHMDPLTDVNELIDEYF